MPLPPGLQSPREVIAYYDSLYEELVESGKANPFVYPWAGIGGLVVLIYLLVDHRRSPLLQWLRYPVFGFLFAFQGWCITTNKAKHPAAAMGIGLISAWGIIWSAALIIFHDFQTDFRRIQYHGAPAGKELNEPKNGSAKHEPNVGKKRDGPGSRTEFHRTPYWQEYPETFGARLNWVADLFCAFRGVGWNMQMYGVPPVPKRIEDQLRESHDGELSPVPTTNKGVAVSKTGVRRFDNRRALIIDTLWRLAVSYIVVDIVKTIMHGDPYFWGYTEAPAPAYLPQMMRSSFLLLRSYRLLVALAGIYTVLYIAFRLGPLFFCAVLGPTWAGIHGEAWMNPADMFGSIQCVLDRGLAGWWAGFWHQVFRFGFEAPAEILLKRLRIDKRSPQGKAIGLFFAFFTSGCLHASGSHTQLGDTRPLMGPLRFFMLQALGIMFQIGARDRIHKLAPALTQSPKWVGQAFNFSFVMVWLFFTAPLLVDDFAQGGAWLLEPVAISPLRGLGLGARDDTWWCWYSGLYFWRDGEHSWQRGIAA